MLDRHAFFHPELLHQARDAVRPEDAHQVVLERQVEAGRTGIALAAGAAAQLVVDPAGLVALGGKDVQTVQADDFVVLPVGELLEMLEDSFVVALRHAIERVEVKEVHELIVVDEPFLALREPFGNLLGERLLPGHELGIPPEQDVGAAARHVRGNRDRPPATGLGDELGFLRVVLRVQDDMFVRAPARRGAALQSPPVEHRRELFGLFNRHRADENGPAIRMLVEDFGDDRVPFLLLGAVHEIRVLDAAQRAVGRDHHDIELVDLRELLRFGVRRAGHAGELCVLAEVILEGDRRERLVLALDFHLLFRFHGLVQAVAPAPPGHQAARELVDDDDLALLHHVVHVAVEQGVGAQSLVDVVEERHVGRVVQPAGLHAMGEQLLGLRHPGLG